MSLSSLENLVKTGQLHLEPMSDEELMGLLQSGTARLEDAHNIRLSSESRFDLAYNASHAFALAALRWHGYRCSNRYLVFQILPHTLQVGQEVWRVLAKCHNAHNLAEYEGYFDVEPQLLNALLQAADELQKRVVALI